MLIHFETIPQQAKIWIFPSSRVLHNRELDIVKEQSTLFLQSWTAHKADLNAAFIVIDHAFLVISVDEQQTGASGCSIDKLFQFVKTLGAQLDVSFLDRLNVTLLNADGSLTILPLKEVEQNIQQAELNAHSLVYDITILSAGDLTTKFKVPLGETWLSRYLLN